jgi:hypothetical protein
MQRCCVIDRPVPDTTIHYQLTTHTAVPSLDTPYTHFNLRLTRERGAIALLDAWYGDCHKRRFSCQHLQRRIDPIFPYIAYKGLGVRMCRKSASPQLAQSCASASAPRLPDTRKPNEDPTETSPLIIQGSLRGNFLNREVDDPQQLPANASFGPIARHKLSSTPQIYTPHLQRLSRLLRIPLHPPSTYPPP